MPMTVGPLVGASVSCHVHKRQQFGLKRTKRKDFRAYHTLEPSKGSPRAPYIPCLTSL